MYMLDKLLTNSLFNLLCSCGFFVLDYDLLIGLVGVACFVGDHPETYVMFVGVSSNFDSTVVVSWLKWKSKDLISLKVAG
uniref:Uncharacterized protein n=1 Tax=Lotus japonicus TaxID=34305 RepID=I3SMC2_LOTJA|nr:unknown [Lotus japonicus]